MVDLAGGSSPVAENGLKGGRLVETDDQNVIARRDSGGIGASGGSQSTANYKEVMVVPVQWPESHQ